MTISADKRAGGLSSPDGLSLTVGLTDVDTLAPVLSNPVDTASGSTAGAGSVDTTESNGRLYWVLTQSETSPTAAQVRAGEDDMGGAPDDSGDQAVTDTGSISVSGGFTSLAAETTYYAHFMHEDARGNRSAVSTGDGFTTEAA